METIYQIWIYFLGHKRELAYLWIVRISICIVFLIPISNINSQTIIKQVKSFDLKKTENIAIEKTRKKLNLPAGKHLNVMSFFKISMTKDFDKETGSVYEFLDKFHLYSKYNQCFVYDDSLNLLSIATSRTIIPNFNPELSKGYQYVRYFDELKPDFIFEYDFAPTNNPMYFCYKGGEVTIAYLNNSKTRIISFSLSKLRNWTYLNQFRWSSNLIKYDSICSLWNSYDNVSDVLISK